MSMALKKPTRITMRCNPETKKKIEEAASLVSKSVSQFILDCALKTAQLLEKELDERSDKI